MPLTEMGKWSIFRRKDKGLGLGIWFQSPFGYLERAVKSAIGYASLEFTAEVWGGDISWGTSLQVEFAALKLEEIKKISL